MKRYTETRRTVNRQQAASARKRSSRAKLSAPVIPTPTIAGRLTAVAGDAIRFSGPDDRGRVVAVVNLQDDWDVLHMDCRRGKPVELQLASELDRLAAELVALAADVRSKAPTTAPAVYRVELLDRQLNTQDEFTAADPAAIAVWLLSRGAAWNGKRFEKIGRDLMATVRYAGDALTTCEVAARILPHFLPLATEAETDAA